ncbi:MAG: alpha/beta hydrolase [Acidobacteriaceae bacterium]|nr:alpha/beta hydrolase [Acidobacteriaceae bacterium]
MNRLLWRWLGAHLAVALAAFAADYSMVGNIRYDKFPETVLDVLQPPHPALTNRPAVLMIHGGGWTSGSKNDTVEACKPFLERDYVVVNIDYRLADAAPAPAAVLDTMKAAHWTVEHAAEYKIDPKRLLAAGFSAGGHLALMAGMATPESGFGPTTRFAGIIDFYGIADVAAALEQKSDFAVQWIAAAPEPMQLAKQLSPINYVRKDVPPVLIVHGDQDHVVPFAQSVQLNAALKKAGAKSELITVSGAQHGFTPAQQAEIWPPIFKWLEQLKI